MELKNIEINARISNGFFFDTAATHLDVSVAQNLFGVKARLYLSWGNVFDR